MKPKHGPKPESLPLSRLKHHVTGAIERGEKIAIESKPLKKATSHTPGPWIAKGNLVCTAADWNSEQIGALKHGFQAIISLQQGEAQAEANARLISAAPDLLKTLELILTDNRLMNALSKEQARAILDTIAKATGGAE